MCKEDKALFYEAFSNFSYSVSNDELSVSEVLDAVSYVESQLDSLYSYLLKNFVLGSETTSKIREVLLERVKNSSDFIVSFDKKVLGVSDDKFRMLISVR